MLKHLARDTPEPPGRTPSPTVAIPIREVTREIAFAAHGWTPQRRARVAELFDGMAGDWHERASDPLRQIPLTDAYERGGVPQGGTCLELGAGTGARTPFLAEHHERVVPADLSWPMIRQVPAAIASPIQTDASSLPFPNACLDVVVLVNMFLFPAEMDRVLAASGALVWVNTSGDQTPIYLSAEDVDAALPGEWTGVASEAGWGTWAVLRRAAPARHR